MGTMKSISSVWVVTQFCITSLLLLTMLASSRSSSRSSTTAQAATGAPSAGPVASSSSVAAPQAQNNSTGFCQTFIVSSDYTCSEYMVGGCCCCWCFKCISGLQLQLWLLDWQQQQQQVRTRWVTSLQFLWMGVGGDCGWLFACDSTHCSSGGAGNKGTRFLVPWHHGGCYLAIYL